MPDLISSEEIQRKADASNPVVEVRQDNWSNFFAGLNGKKDKSKYTEFGDVTLLDDYTLGAMYMADGLGGRIIDVVADDMTREWIYLEGPADDIIKEELVRLDAEKHFNEAIKWQRLYGGSLLIMGIMDGQMPDKKVNENRIRNIEYLKVVDRTCIPINECVFDTNPRSPNFGKVMVYKVKLRVKDQEISMMVHASRCIPFFNDPVPSYIGSASSLDLRYWGMSSLQRVYEDIRDLGGISQSTVNILYEFIVGKYKLEHLNEMLAQGAEKQLVTRMEIMELSKSILNAVILSSNEEYTRDYATLAGLPEVIDRFMLKLSGSTGIPVTRLFGRSPAGLNATGESDLRNYYDLVEAQQRNRLFPPLRRLVTLLCKFKGVEVPEIEFNSLYQLDEKEKADVEKTYAEIEEIKSRIEKNEIETQVRSQEEIRVARGYQAPAELDEPDSDDDGVNDDPTS